MLTQSHLTLRTGRLKPFEDWRFEGDELFFVFPTRGAGQFVSNTGSSRIVQGDAVALSGCAGATLSAFSGGELTFWWFSISLEHLFPLFAVGEISLLHDLPEALRSPRIYPATHALATQCDRLLGDMLPQFDLDHRSQLLRIAALLLSPELKTSRSQRVGFVRAEDHLMEVFDRLSTDEILNLSVEELARKFGCSRRHLSRLFRQHFGLSVAALRMEMRLLKAVSLLRDWDAKIINVAVHCGFNHLGLFNTCFKRRFGVTPSQWRNKARDKSQPDKPGSTVDTCPLRVSGLCPGNGKTKNTGAPAAKATRAQKSGWTNPPALELESDVVVPLVCPKSADTTFPSMNRFKPMPKHQATGNP